MNIYTLIKVDNQKVPNKEVLENIEQYGPMIIAQRRVIDIRGFLVIKQGDIELIIDDDLSGIVNNFCLEAIVEVLSSNSATVRHLEYEGEITMEVDDDLLLLDGDHIESTIFNKNEFLLHLYNCGLDFIQLLKSFNPQETFKAYYENLEESASFAKAALEKNEIL